MASVAIVIEPSYIALDEREIANGDELERRLSALRAARRLIEVDHAVAVLTAEETSTALLDCGYYPFDGRLGTLLRRFGLGSIYTENDLRVIVQDIIVRSNSLQEFVGVSMALYDNDIQVSPQCDEFYTNNALLELFVEVLGVLAAAMTPRPRLAETVRVCCPASITLSGVEFSGTLSASEPDVGYNGKVRQEIMISDQYQNFILSLDGGGLWRSAESADDVVFALLVGALKRGVATGKFHNAADIPLFGVGSEFMDSLARNQAGGAARFASVTYETAVGVICGDSGRAMRVTKRGGSVQRSRADGGLAWRSHITSSHEALRLMYWTAGGCIEFANVGVKNELVIAEGDGRSWGCRELLLS